MRGRLPGADGGTASRPPTHGRPTRTDVGLIAFAALVVLTLAAPALVAGAVLGGTVATLLELGRERRSAPAGHGTPA